MGVTVKLSSGHVRYFCGTALQAAEADARVTSRRIICRHLASCGREYHTRDNGRGRLANRIHTWRKRGGVSHVVFSIGATHQRGEAIPPGSQSPNREW